MTSGLEGSGQQIPVTVVGAGYMGANHARVAAEHPRFRLVAVVDSDPRRAQTLGEQFGVPHGTSLELCERGTAVVATSTASHASIAIELLSAGVPVLVEKPLASDLENVGAMLETSMRTGTPLVCGFVERFNAAILTAKNVLEGDPIHVATVRHSPFNDRATSSVVQDLLIHDLDVITQLLGSDLRPSMCRAVGTRVARSEHLEAVDALLGFRSGTVNLSASRLGQRKIRTLSIATEDQLVETDLFRQSVTVYRHVAHSQLTNASGGYRSETVIETPYVRHQGEPLFAQLGHFANVVCGRVAEDLSAVMLSHRLAAAVEDQLVGISSARSEQISTDWSPRSAAYESSYV